ncbi:MAG: autotransporter assembly complex protein TamA [Rhodospirillaceae bacterium]
MALSAPQTAMYALFGLLLASLAFACCARAQDEPAPPLPAPSRFRVVIEAPRPYQRMLEDGLDLVRWQRDQRMTPELLERLVAEARTAVEQAMAAEGYFEPKVRTAIEPGPEMSTVRITVDPGERTRITDVNLRFEGTITNDTTADRERITKVRNEWSLRRGAPFRQADWDNAKRNALASLRGGRYASASITNSAARIDPEKRTAVLEVTFDSGPVFHVGEVRVSGLTRYPESIVQNLNPMTPGEEYDRDRLILYQRRLLQTGYFSTVQMTVDPDPAHAEAAPLLVTVFEARTQRVETGVSFSTDTRLRLQLDYGHSDLFESAYRLRTLLQADARAQSGEVSIDTPPEPGGYWNTYSSRLRRTNIQGQRTQEAMVGAARNWGPWTTPSQIAVSAHLEQKDIAGSAGESVHAVFLGYRRTFRHTDELVQPRRGIIGTLQLGTSVPGLATRQFVRGTAKATLLWPLGSEADLTLRGEIGVVLASARFGIPSSFLFRTGGDQTVRGYAFESLGVRQGDATVGGRYMALGSVEYTRWITPDWGAAVFMDAGDAFDEPRAFRAARGYGVGARWRSPVGPFRADLAYGERTRNVRLHFSVGFTF